MSQVRGLEEEVALLIWGRADQHLLCKCRNPVLTEYLPSVVRDTRGAHPGVKVVEESGVLY